MTVRAPEELRRTMAERANRLGVPRNALVVQILWDWVGREGSRKTNDTQKEVNERA